MSEWDQFPIVESSGFEQFPELDAGQQVVRQPDDSPPPDDSLPPQEDRPNGFRSRAAEVWNSIRGASFSDIASGIGEPLMQAATGAAGTSWGGLAGIAAMSAPDGYTDDDYMDGRPQYRGRPDPVEAVHAGQEALTYQPRTEAGKAVSETIAQPFEWYDEKVDRIAELSGGPDDTLGATMAYTAMAALPAIFGRNRNLKAKGDSPSAPTAEQLKARANDLYKRADEAKVGIRSDSYGSMMARVREKLTSEGFDEGLHPATAAALKRLEQDVGSNLTLKGAEINRRVVGSARAKMDKDDARLAGEVLDIYDNWMETLGNRDLLMGDPSAAKLLPEARGLWSRAKKADEIAWLVERAARSAGGYTQSGIQNALVTEFRNFTKNPKNKRRFTADEWAALTRIADGDLPTNLLRYVGKFAPKGVVSAGVGAAFGSASPLGPVLGPLSVYGIGEMGLRGATALTKRNVERASDMVRQDPKR